MYDPKAQKRRHPGSSRDIYVTSKTRRGVVAIRVPAEGSDKAPPKTFGKREQERATRNGQ